MKNLIKISFILIFSYSFIVSAQDQQMPAPGTPRNFSLPPVNSFELDNGLKVTLVRYGDIPKATVRLIVRSGNLNEPEDEVWLADFTSDLMKEGTITRTGKQIADEVAGMGGELSVSTGVETTAITTDVLSEYISEAVSLVADVAMNPVFPESETARLKNDLLRNLNIQKSEPSNIAYELFSRVMYPGHPYGRIFPEPGMIKAFDAAKAKDFYSANFGAQRSHLYIAGVFDESKAEKTIREAFGEWAKGPAPLINIPSAAPKNMIYFADRPGAPQSVLNIGLPTIDPSNKDYLPLILTNELLGGSFTSRITLNIREDKGYTYSPYSSVASRYRTGYWMQFAEVATPVTIPSIKEIFKEIRRLTDERVSDKELNGIKNYVCGVFVLRNSTRQGIISQLAFLDLHGLDLSYITNYISNIRSISADDVQRIMKTYLDPSKMTIVIAGDRKSIGKEVEQFGTVSNQ
jgi:predicted Zn-dependent peptidase